MGNQERKPITKAVIAAAGIGSRMLPATKAVPKELLTIVDRPAIQHVVEELVAGGIKEILFVVSSGKGAICEHFSSSPELEASLADAGKHALLDIVRGISNLASFFYVDQEGPYGNGTPFLCAEEFLAGDPCIYVFPDDLICSRESFTKRLNERYLETGCPVVGVDEVHPSQTHLYGIVDYDSRTGVMRRVVEKPPQGTATTNSAQFGRFVLTSDILQILKETALGKGNELWLTNAIAAYIAMGNRVYVERIPDGKWVTVGDPLNNFKAVLAFALADANIGDGVRNHLEEFSFVK